MAEGVGNGRAGSPDVSSRITVEQFDLLRKLVADRCGIELGDDKSYLMESRLAGLLVRHGVNDFGDFYNMVAGDAGGVLADEVVDAIATNETSWFRDGKPWELMTRALIPGCLAKLRADSSRRVRIWSAACSTGQEAYSVAMLIDELCGSGVTGERIDIVGTDISGTALRVAEAGIYNRIAMSRGLSEARRKAFFREKDGAWELDKRIRERVRFERINLRRDFGGMGGFDLVLLRNVAIYFSAHVRGDLYDRIGKAVNAGGVLLLGAAESMVGYPTDFEPVVYERILYYRKVWHSPGVPG